MPLPHYYVYREQLTSLFHGHALWEPDPTNVYPHVSIGDVGYVREGHFCRLFNVLLEWDHPSNRTFVQPEPYTRLDVGPFTNIRELVFPRGDYYSRNVIRSHETDDLRAEGSSDDLKPTEYTCNRGKGALLTLPRNGLSKDAIRTKAFEDYMRDNVDSWFSFAMRSKLGIERMEDLIFVTGCTLVTSWGIAAFPDSAVDAEISVRFGGATFDWHQVHPSATYHNSHQNPDNSDQNQCIFIRGFRAKRVSLQTRSMNATGPRPNDSDNAGEDEIRVTQIAAVRGYRDPLIGILDYIAENCPDNTLAIVHDDDLLLVDELEVLTADAVEGFLRQNEVNVLVKNGVAILYEDEDQLELPGTTKAIFYAEAELEGELVPLILHPVLSKYLLKIDTNNQSVDHDYYLPKEELNSPAVHPPMLSLKLENHQGYPQPITVQATSDSQSIGVTVQDVLRAIHGDVRKLSHRREWTKLNSEERTMVDVALRERCKEDSELGQGPCRIDFLGGRDRLQVLPRVSPDGPMLPTPNAG